MNLWNINEVIEGKIIVSINDSLKKCTLKIQKN